MGGMMRRIVPMSFCLSALALAAVARPVEDGGVAGGVAPSPARYEDALQRGRQVAETRDFAGAVDAFVEATRADPAKPEGWFELARAQTAMGAAADALKSYERGLAIDPEDEAAHEEIGLLRRQLDDAAGAVREFQQALARKPDDPDLLFALGEAEQKSGDAQSARQIYERILARDPKNARARVNLAELLSERGEVAGAVDQLSTAREYIGWIRDTTHQAMAAHRSYETVLGAVRPEALSKYTGWDNPEWIDFGVRWFYDHATGAAAGSGG